METFAHRYRVEQTLGEGGMGTVYLVHDRVTDRKVALKRLKRAEDALTLKHEFWTMSRLLHPNTVEVYDYGELEDGSPYFTMEVVEGQGLDELLPLPEAEVRPILVGIARALGYIHSQGLVHCDIKPENIRATGDGIKLMDYGFMEPIGRSHQTVNGTLLYLAPEALKGGRIDPRSDLYSLGALGYHLLTGHPPFEGSLQALIDGHLHQNPIFPGSGLDRVLARLLAKDPLRRYPSTDELLLELGESREQSLRLLAPSFIGRKDELKFLEKHLSRIRKGKSVPALLIEGNAGLGKSRLLEEFRFRAQIEGIPFLRGGCIEEPFGAFRPILQQAVALCKSRDPERLERLSPWLSKLLPELGTPGAPLEPKEEKMRLLGAISELLFALTPLVVVLEDLHQCDESSRELVQYLLRNLEEKPMLFIGTSQKEEEFPSTLSLEGFAETECRDMVASMLGEEPSSELLEWLEERSGGNPLFIESLLRHLHLRGALTPDGGHWQARLDEEIPDDLQEVLSERLRALTPESRALATVLALVGRADFSTLVRIEGAEETVFRSLSELERHGLVDNQEGYSLPSLLGEILADCQTKEERRALHRRIAEALEDPRRRAHHWIEAEDERIRDVALEAALESLRLFSHAEAERFLRAGLAFEADDRQEKSEMLRLLGDSLRMQSRYREALDVLEEALPSLEGEPRVAALVSLGKIHQVLSNYPRALEGLEEAMTLSDQPRLLARCLNTAGRIHYLLGNSKEATESYERGLEAARQAEDPALEGESLAFLGFLRVNEGSLDAGTQALKESLRIRRELDDPIGLNDTFMMLGNAQLVQGSWKEAEECFQGCLELTRRIGNRDEKIFAGINLSLTLLEQGEFAPSASFANTACEEAEATGSKYALGSGLAIRSFAYFHLGRLGEAIDGLAAALDIARDTSNRYLELFALIYRTEMLAQMGRWGEALDAGMMAKNLINETQNHEGELPLLATMAEVYSYFNEHELARGYLERAEHEAVERQMKGVLARILKAKAVWFGSRGAWAEAMREAREALVLAQETGARFIEGDVKWILGEACLAQGRREKAWQEYQGAQLLARTLESAGLELRALQGLSRSDSRNGAIYKRQYRERLTGLLATLAPTEQEIAGEAWEKFLLFKGGKQETPEELQEQVSQFIEQLTDFSTNLKDQVAEWASLKRSHKHLEQLVQFSLSIHQLHDLDEVLNRVVDLIVEITGSDRGFLLMYQDGQLQCHAMKNIRTDNALEWGVSEAIAKEVLLSEEPLCIYDAMNDARFSKQESVQSLHLRTVICVPLCIHEQTVGVIYVDRQSVNEQFSQADLDLLQSLAAQAANAIENAMLHSEWQDKSRKLEMLNTLSRTVSRTLVPQEVHELVIKLTLEVSDAERGFLFMLDEGHLRCKAGFDREGNPLSQEESPISQSILQKVLSTHEPMIILDAMTDEELQYQASIMALNLRTVMCVPLTAKEETVGLIYVDSQAVRSFTQSDLDLLEAIASHASIAVENASLYGQLTERAAELETMVQAYEEATLRASIDFLTGTYNRRHFIDTFRRDFAQSRRYRRSLALMMIDLDHFKSFNDTYGHPTGDRALQTVAQIIQQTVRAEDVVARYGGEEFIVGLPDTDLEGALIVAERIRSAVAEYPIEEARPVTVSIGTALCQATDERIAELIERADQALYEAKKLGRNRVCVN